MIVHYLVFRPDSLTYTIAKALSFGGHSVQVWVADPDHARRPPEGLLTRLHGTANVSVSPVADLRPAEAVARLIVQFFPRLIEQSRAIAPLAGNAQRLTIITAGDRSHPWRKALRLQGRELQALAPWLGLIDRIAYKDGFHRLDLFGLFKRRQMVGFDVHSQFLHDDSSFAAIHAADWEPASRRPFRANFLGSCDPEIRRRVLDSARAFFRERNSARTAEKPWFWHEYTDAAPAGLDASQFLEILSTSDFTLCPPGYSVVTHRPMEALLRGSIPVLHASELDLYAIGLRDGLNCIAVEPRRWPEALQRITQVDGRQLVEMRRHIRLLVAQHVAYPESARRMCARLGVNE